ncbi:MAG: hypothetical protein ACUZ8O_08800 [Candidatus Anammoxibacter sp.]
MGLFGLFKTNLRSIKKQKEIGSAMQAEDNERINILITESINEVLHADLTKKQLSILETIKNDNNESLNQVLTQAFHRGWVKNGKPDLSSAMDEVLRSALEAIKAQKAIDEYRKQLNKESKKPLKRTKIRWRKHKNTMV